MVDGLGIPQGALHESIYADFPALCRCIEQYSVPLDANLGLPGEPQSATGQTALFTGINGAKLLGRHLSGFPNAELRETIRKENIFGKLQARGLSVTFANAYARQTEQTLPRAFRSVTTVATLSAFGRTRTREDMLAGRAVYHDLTRHWLKVHGGVNVPLITEEEAAAHLLGIVRSVDFCLFEYFLTDHAGHRGDDSQKRAILGSLDRFFQFLMDGVDTENELFLWTSDHGNLEQPSTKQHTRNPVPFCAYGWRARDVREGMNSILQVCDRVERVLS